MATSRKATAQSESLTYQTYGEQYSFLTTDAHFSLLRGGIGSGKSVGGAMRAVLAACGQIGSRSIPAPNLGVVTAPTYNMLRDASIRTFFDVAGNLVVDYNKTEMLATLANGSEVLFRSTDNPDRLRGPNAAWWWGNEGGYYTSNVWAVMVGRLRQHGILGSAWVTTTPKGRNWLWQTFVRDNAENPDYAVFRLATKGNPFLEPEIFDAWQNTYHGDFAAQELDGEFVAFEGLVYPTFRRAFHSRLQMPERKRIKSYIAGVDWGFANPGVILVIGMDYDSRMWLVHEEYARRRHIDDWASVAYQLHQLYKIDTFWCDPSQPDYIKKLTDKGCNAVGAKNDVMPGISAVQARLVERDDNLPGLIVSASAANTLTEFEQYQWATHRDGLRDAPLKVNDHAMDALRYPIYNTDGQTTPELAPVRTVRVA